MSKKRILICSEASYTLSGFGVYAKEVISRLYNSGKYEIAEFCQFGMVNDPRDVFPWKVYPNMVGPQDPRFGDYQSGGNQFGAWRFERVLIDFKPDFVFSYLDPWMFMYQETTPLRKYFHRIIMPTCDSVPQQEEWIDNFCHADAVFAYTDWAIDVFKNQSGGLMKTEQALSPGVTLDEYKPVINKLEHKRKFGFPNDINIVGTVMRNQRRKLYPDLMDAFNLFLDKCREEGNHELAQKTYLYFHVAYPDNKGCWNLPRLIKEKGLGHKILFSYICRNCRAIFATPFQDAKTVCPRCNVAAAVTPRVEHGFTSAEMHDMYNLFDVYVQYANCEGCGMPAIEAAACGVPVMAVDYSAMADVVRKVNGFPIRVESLHRVVDEDAYKAAPDNKDLANKLYKFLSLPISERQKKSIETREKVKHYYTWDRTAGILMDYIDKTELTGLQGQWDAPPSYLQPRAEAKDCPPNLGNEEYVDWMLTNVLGDVSQVSTMMALDMVRALNCEMIVATNQDNRPYTREDVVAKIEGLIKNSNLCEHARVGQLPLSPEDYIEYAHSKENK